MLKAELQEKYNTLKAEHDGFIDKIITVAGNAAYDHELCHVLEETFKTMGIPVPARTVTVTETKTYTLPGFEAFRLGLNSEDTSESERLTEVKEVMATQARYPDRNNPEADWALNPVKTEITSVELIAA